MAHEITRSDRVVLAHKQAWHGLGIVVDHCPTIAEALELANLNWTVEQTLGVNGVLGDGQTRVVTETHKINVRSDTREVLGVVGSTYVPVQNAELGAFVETLAGDREVVQVESAGSIRGGKRVWFLIRGESFSAWQGKDEVCRYLLAANGHDGSLAVTLQPTSIRVVCSNTLHMSLGAPKCQPMKIYHMGDMKEKLDEAKRALDLLDRSGDLFQQQVHALSAKSMTREQLQRFWLEVYTAAEGPIPATPTTEQEKRARKRATEALEKWGSNFDKEVALSGPNAWTAFNAVTNWYDHQKGDSDKLTSDGRTFRNWWGASAEGKQVAFKTALQLV